MEAELLPLPRPVKAALELYESPRPHHDAADHGHAHDDDDAFHRLHAHHGSDFAPFL